MCNCIDEATENLQKKSVELIEKSYTVAEWKDKGHFMHKTFSMSGGPSKISMPFIIQYVRRKVNGEPEKKVTTQTNYMYPAFCPFCGEKYPES